MAELTKTLTKGEEDIMKILWGLGKGTVNDILGHCCEPKPKYTTVATFLKLLEDKGFAGHISQGKSNMYYPLVEQKEYAGSIAGNMIESFFGGSVLQMLSFFSSEKKLSAQEKQDLLKLAQEIIDKD